MSLGKGSVYSSSIRQKLEDPQFHCEAELVGGNNDMMSLVLWTCSSLPRGAGIYISRQPGFQDNESAILIEKRPSIRRHLEIRIVVVSR